MSSTTGDLVKLPSDGVVSQLLQCPICKEIPHPPIYLCVNGHSICRDCDRRIDCCPLCKNPMSVGRNFTMEDLISNSTFKCPHENEGCQEIISGADMKEHVTNCQFKPPEEPQVITIEDEDSSHPDDNYEEDSFDIDPDEMYNYEEDYYVPFDPVPSYYYAGSWYWGTRPRPRYIPYEEALREINRRWSEGVRSMDEEILRITEQMEAEYATTQAQDSDMFDPEGDELLASIPMPEPHEMSLGEGTPVPSPEDPFDAETDILIASIEIPEVFDITK